MTFRFKIKFYWDSNSKFNQNQFFSILDIGHKIIKISERFKGLQEKKCLRIRAHDILLFSCNFNASKKLRSKTHLSQLFKKIIYDSYLHHFYRNRELLNQHRKTVSNLNFKKAFNKNPKEPGYYFLLKTIGKLPMAILRILIKLLFQIHRKISSPIC